MTTINTVKTLLAATILGFSTLASAAQYEIKVNGNFVKDPSYSSSFGVTVDSQPVTFTMVVDDSLGGTMVFPAGTPLGGSGASFPQDVTLISASAIVSTQYVIGNTTFTKADLVEQPLGSTGSTFHILLDGPLNSGSVGQAMFTLNQTGVGYVGAGFISCPSNCQVVNSGDTYDYSNGSPGILESLSATRTVLVQTPVCTTRACKAIEALRAKIEALGLTPAVKELILAKTALATRNVALAKQHVRNYINIIKSLRGNTLKPALADFLILLGKALLLIIK